MVKKKKELKRLQMAINSYITVFIEWIQPMTMTDYILVKNGKWEIGFTWTFFCLPLRPSRRDDFFSKSCYSIYLPLMILIYIHACQMTMGDWFPVILSLILPNLIFSLRH
jgi:hypothetical protein